MKKIILSVILVSLVSGCGSNNIPISQFKTPDMTPGNNVQVVTQSSPSKNMLESFKAYVRFSKPDILDKSGLAELLMSVKSLMGKKYSNENSASRYRVLMPGDKIGMSGKIRLGKDGILYYEHWLTTNNYEYFPMGTFALENIKDGNEIKFKLNAGVDLGMNWKGLNPMNHDSIEFNVKKDITPVKKTSSEFIG